MDDLQSIHIRLPDPVCVQQTSQLQTCYMRELLFQHCLGTIDVVVGKFQFGYDTFVIVSQVDALKTFLWFLIMTVRHYHLLHINTFYFNFLSGLLNFLRI